MKVGSLVECVKKFRPKQPGQKVPELGKIYEVNFVEVRRLNGIPYLGLVEIPGNKLFNIIAFREVVPPGTISIEEIINADIKN